MRLKVSLRSGLGIILAFSLAAYYWLEIPARKWILNRFSHKTRA